MALRLGFHSLVVVPLAMREAAATMQAIDELHA